MRVIGGKAKGRRLASVSGSKTRPTADRIKESLFNIIANEVANVDFLDLFAGNGGIGIEALSRGAGQVVFIDKNRHCTKMIKTNLNTTELGDRAEVYTNDVIRALSVLERKGRIFDVVFIDPPYNQGYIEKTLSALSEYKLVKKDGLVITELSNKEDIPDSVLNLFLTRNENYGDTILGFYRNKEDPSEN